MKTLAVSESLTFLTSQTHHPIGGRGWNQQQANCRDINTYLRCGVGLKFGDRYKGT